MKSVYKDEKILGQALTGQSKIRIPEVRGGRNHGCEDRVGKVLAGRCVIVARVRDGMPGEVMDQIDMCTAIRMARGCGGGREDGLDVPRTFLAMSTAAQFGPSWLDCFFCETRASAGDEGFGTDPLVRGCTSVRTEHREDLAEARVAQSSCRVQDLPKNRCREGHKKPERRRTRLVRRRTS